MPKSTTATPRAAARAPPGARPRRRRSRRRAARRCRSRPRGCACAGSVMSSTSSSSGKKKRKRPVSRSSSLRRVALDRHAEVHAVVVVDGTSARSWPCGPRACGLDVAAPGRAQDHASRRAEGARRRRRLGLALARVAHASTRPCRREDVLRGRRVGRAPIISRTAGSPGGDLLALLVAQRLDVQEQRLLDLRPVEQARRGSRARPAGGRAARSPRRAPRRRPARRAPARC